MARKIAPVARVVLWPVDLESRYSISGPTRWRWEKRGILPPRDVYINGEAVGWKPSTLDKADRSRVKRSQAAADAA